MPEDLTARIRRLERSNRLHRLALVALGLLAMHCGGITSQYEHVSTNTLEVGTITFHGRGGDAKLDAATLTALLAATAATSAPAGSVGTTPAPAAP
jgi:hypothetical protein